MPNDPVSPAAPQAAPARRHRVLVGDSESWAIDLFQRAAEQYGAELHVSGNGVDVLEQFKSLAPSLVVLDTLLPKLDGLQAAGRIREMELGRITPVVVSSALYRPGEDVDRLQRKFGFTEFLPKPFRIEEIVGLFEQYLNEESDGAAPETDLYEDGLPFTPVATAETPLSEMSVPALLCQLYRGRRSGTLTLRRGEITKVVFFEQGHITHARSNSKRDRLGRILLRSRRITLEDYERARRLQTDASGHLQLGAALVQLGVLSDNDVANAVVSQILSVLFSLFEWDSGSWSFLDSTSVPPEYTRFSFNTANLIFWGLRQLEGRKPFGRFLPNPKVLLERPPDIARFKEQLNLTFLEEQILGLVDGRKPLGEILALGRLTQIDVERVVFSLLVLGILRAATDAGAGAPAPGISSGAHARAMEPKGSLLQTSVVRLLSRLHLGGHGGTLRVRGGGRESAVYFDAGEIVFAHSSLPQHRLGEILLRSGTIAQADYDRAVAQIGPGHERRIGTVLLEMRAISLEELHAALRLQVQDIVLDLFRWREGDYSYEAGVPAPELVLTLPATTANLIMEGSRIAATPPGVLQLLEQPDMLLHKAWGDERLVRQLQLSAAERRLLSFIESGRPAREVAALGLLPIDELARSLHGLLGLELVKATAGAASPRPSFVPSARLGQDTMSEEDTPFPVLHMPPPRPAQEPGLAALAAGRSTSEQARLQSENEQLRSRVSWLERELAELKALLASRGGNQT